jgi:hypothetical protein
VAHGLSIDLLVELVRAGLATAKAERVVGYLRADHGGGAQNVDRHLNYDRGGIFGRPTREDKRPLEVSPPLFVRVVI